MIKLIIAGGRDFKDYDLLEKTMVNLPFKSDVILSGNCKTGADYLGELYAKRHTIKLVTYPADWENLGKKAGPIRNDLMASQATHLLAFPDGVSRGTKNMIDRAKYYKLDIIVVSY